MVWLVLMLFVISSGVFWFGVGRVYRSEVSRKSVVFILRVCLGAMRL